MNILLLLPEILAFKKERALQQQFLESTILPEITLIEKEWGDELDTYLKHKIFKYYALYVPVVIGKSFARLYGRGLSAKETRLLTLLGIVTPFFDDFFDIERLSTKEIKNLILNPYDAPSNTLMQKAFTTFGKEIVSSIPDKDFFYCISMNVFDAQVNSEKQENPSISTETNKLLAQQKGGYSLLFYYTALDVPENEAVKQVVYKTGALLQLSNDIFDTYKDIQKDIYTLVRNCNELSSLKKYYREQYDDLIKEAYTLPFPKKNIDKYLRRSQLLFAMTFVALDKLISLQKRKGKNMDWKNLSRKELICDAEKFPIQMKWLKELAFL